MGSILARPGTCWRTRGLPEKSARAHDELVFVGSGRAVVGRFGRVVDQAPDAKQQRGVLDRLDDDGYLPGDVGWRQAQGGGWGGGQAEGDQHRVTPTAVLRTMVLMGPPGTQ